MVFSAHGDQGRARNGAAATVTLGTSEVFVAVAAVLGTFVLVEAAVEFSAAADTSEMLGMPTPVHRQQRRARDGLPALGAHFEEQSLVVPFTVRLPVLH